MVLKEILRLKQQAARKIDRLRYMPQCHNDLFSLVSNPGDSGYIPLLLPLVSRHLSCLSEQQPLHNRRHAVRLVQVSYFCHSDSKPAGPVSTSAWQWKKTRWQRHGIVWLSCLASKPVWVHGCRKEEPDDLMRW